MSYPVFSFSLFFRRCFTIDITTEKLEECFASCGDFEKRRINIGLNGNLFIYVCWVDGLCSGDNISRDILKPLSDFFREADLKDELSAIEKILSGSVYSYSVKRRNELSQVLDDLTHGHCALIFDSSREALCFEVRSSQVRAVAEPSLEKSLKGAKDSFTETLRVNTSLVRRRLCTPSLKLIQSEIGRRSNTTAAIMYLDGVVNPELVAEAGRRLDNIDIDALIASGSLEYYIADMPLSPFPQLIHTERPDRFAMYLAEGRVGILLDGLPVGLVLPVSFAEFMKVTGDSSMHFTVSGILSLLRYGALLLGLFLPAFYVAVAMYHQEMIPTRLLLSIIEAKQNVPFSTGLEVLGMIIAFGLLQEAGLRLPNPIGDTVSIIGALIVGQSAVEAQLVSPIAIIVVALSGIACYTLPSQDMGSAVRLFQLLFLLSAIAGGLYGLSLALCLMLLLLSSMDSFGVNYTSPLSDSRGFGLMRLIFKRPLTEIKYRDPALKTRDRRRQK